MKKSQTNAGCWALCSFGSFFFYLHIILISLPDISVTLVAGAFHLPHGFAPFSINITRTSQRRRQRHAPMAKEFRSQFESSEIAIFVLCTFHSLSFSFWPTTATQLEYYFFLPSPNLNEAYRVKRSPFHNFIRSCFFYYLIIYIFCVRCSIHCSRPCARESAYPSGDTNFKHTVALLSATTK